MEEEVEWKDMNSEEFNDWAIANGLGEKLRVAVESHVVGRGYAPFNGLESGVVLVKVYHSDKSVRFEATDIENRFNVLSDTAKETVDMHVKRIVELEKMLEDLKEKLAKRKRDDVILKEEKEET